MIISAMHRPYLDHGIVNEVESCRTGVVNLIVIVCSHQKRAVCTEKTENVLITKMEGAYLSNNCGRITHN